MFSIDVDSEYALKAILWFNFFQPNVGVLLNSDEKYVFRPYYVRPEYMPQPTNSI